MGACCSSGSSATNTHQSSGENTNPSRRINSSQQLEQSTQIGRAIATNSNNNGQTGSSRTNTLNQEHSPNPNNPRQLYTEIEELQRDLMRMESFFQSVLGQAYHMGTTDPGANFGAQTQARTENNAPPPASQKALRQIPNVALCAEDLMDENNRECCICFEENKIGSKVARLPCGHVYHRQCIDGWLNKHCTCPVCRLELETDDPSYERGRLVRMRSRKPRFRKHELNNLSIRQLRELLTVLKLDDKCTFTEKREIVDKIISSGRIDVIASPEPLEFKISELRAKGVGKLKKAMNEAGVFFDSVDVVEKEDMVQLFINSGRVILLDDPESSVNEASVSAAAAASSSYMMYENGEIYENDHKMDTETASNIFKSEGDDVELVDDAANDLKVEATTNSYTSRYDENVAFSVPTTNESLPAMNSSVRDSSSKLNSYLLSKSVSELKAIGREFGVYLTDCVEKAEMVDKLSPFFKSPS